MKINIITQEIKTISDRDATGELNIPIEIKEIDLSNTNLTEEEVSTEFLEKLLEEDKYSNEILEILKNRKK